MAEIRVERVTKLFKGVRAVDDVSLTVNDGSAAASGSSVYIRMSTISSSSAAIIVSAALSTGRYVKSDVG